MLLTINNIFNKKLKNNLNPIAVVYKTPLANKMLKNNSKYRIQIAWRGAFVYILKIYLHHRGIIG